MNPQKTKDDFKIAMGNPKGKQLDKNKLSKIKAYIAEESKKQSDKRILKNNMLSVQYQIEDYLESENIDVDKILEIEYFVKLYLNEMNLTQTKFAKVIEVQPSNLYKYLKGTRKLNADLALKFSHFFNTAPEMWIMIQIKNEIIQLKRENSNKSKYEKYDYKNVLGLD